MLQPDWKDAVLCVVKIGDNGQYRDGELVEVIDPAEWKDGAPGLSDWMGKVYRMELRPKESKEKLRQVVAYNAMQRIEFKSNIRKVVESKDVIYSAKISAVIDATTATAAEKLAEKTDKAVVLDTSVKVGWYDKDTVVPVVDAKALTDTGIVEKDFTGLALVKDENTISSGSYTLGSGGDYTGFTTYIADTTTQTGNMTGTIISAITNSSATIDSHNYAGYTYKFVGDTDGLGDPGSYRAVTCNEVLALGGSGAGTVWVDKLKIVQGVANKFYYSKSDGTSKTTNCIYDGNGTGGEGLYCNGNSALVAYNCYVYNSANAGIAINGNSAPTIKNCVVYNCLYGYYNYVGTTGTFKNVVLIAGARATAWYQVATATGTNCGKPSSGSIGFGTESGTVSSCSSSDFVSVTATDATFLSIADTSKLYNAGSYDSDVPTSINGVARGAGTTSIGAFEPESAGTPIPVFMNTYRQMRG